MDHTEFNVPEFAPQDDAEPSGADLPLNERVAHKNWKIRQAAYQDLALAFAAEEGEPDAAIFAEYRSSVVDMCKDSNAAAQEGALEAVSAFVQHAGCAGDVAEEIAAAVIDKALGGRPKTKSKAVDLLLSLMEVDTPAPIVLKAIEGTKHKKPKVAQGSTEVLGDAVLAFGMSKQPVKELLACLVGLLEHNNAGVKSAAKQGLVNIHRFMGDAIMPKLADVRSSILKSLESEFAKANGGDAAPTRTLRSERALASASGSASRAGAGGMGTSAAQEAQAAGPTEEELFNMYDEVSIEKQLTSSTYDQLAAKKWSERKEALVTLTEKLEKSPRLKASSDYGELVAALRVIITKDSNIYVVACAVQVLGLLARGLRSAFASHSKQLLPVLLDKFKDKKVQVISAVDEALDRMYQSTSLSLDDVVDCVTSAHSKNKDDKSRARAIAFLERCVRKCTRKVAKARLDTLGPFVLTCVDDKNPDTRTSACEILADVAIIVNRASVEPFVSKMDSSKAKKVDELIESSDLKPSTAAQGAPKQANVNTNVPSANVKLEGEARTSTTTTTTTTTTSSTTSSEILATAGDEKASDEVLVIEADTSAPRKRKAPRPKTAKAAKPQLSSTSSSSSSSSSKPAAKMASGLTGKEEYTKLGGELDASALKEASVALLGEERVQMLQEKSKWKLRLEAMQAIREQLPEWLESEEGSQLAAMLAVHFTDKPGWKEINFQVYKEMLGVFDDLALAQAEFPRRAMKRVISGCVEKLADMKVQSVACDTLDHMSQIAGPNFVWNQVFEAARTHKNIKVQVGACEWGVHVVEAFGLGQFHLPLVLESSKQMMDAPKPQVKTAAMAILVSMRKYVGDQLADMLVDLKPAQMQTYDKEWSKLESQEAPEPTLENYTAPAGGSNSGASSSGGAIELPRTDIASMLSSKLMKKLGDSNWRTRKEAMDTIGDILESNRRIEATVKPLISGLKARLNDSNQLLVIKALQLLGKTASAVGPAIEKYNRMAMQALINMLAANKKNVQEATLVALDAWVEQTGMQPCVHYMPSVLTATSSRATALGWWHAHLETFALESGDVSELVEPMVACLEDRTASVRHMAETFVPIIMDRAGDCNVFDHAAQALKPASKAMVKPVLDQAKANFGGPSTQGAANDTAAETKAEVAATTTKATTVATSTSSTSSAPAKKETVSASSTTSGKPSKGNSGASSASSAGVNKASSQRSNGKSAATAATSGVLKMNRGKKSRASKEKRVKWAFDDLRDELVDAMKEDMRESVSEEVHAQLFHRNFAQHVTGMKTVTAAVSEQVQEAVCSLDLWLKYVSIRVTERQATVLLAALDLLDALFAAAREAEYTLSAWEAGIIMPSVIEHVGNNKEIIRSKMREAVQQFAGLYSAPKVFIFLMDGIKSKNARTKVECLEEVSAMMEQYGVEEVCAASKVLPFVANVVGDRDSHIRTAATNVMTTAYGQLGEQTWKYLKNVGEAQKDILEQAFKFYSGVDKSLDQSTNRSTNRSVHSAVNKSSASSAEAEEQVQDEGEAPAMLKTSTDVSDVAADSQPGKAKASLLDPSLSLELESESLTLEEPQSVHSEQLPSKASVNESQLLVDMWVRDLARDVEAVVAVQALRELADACSDDGNSEMTRALRDNATRVVASLGELMQREVSGDADEVRVFKHLLHAVFQLFSERSLATEVDEHTMVDLVCGVVCLLLNEQLPSLEDGLVLQAANNTMLKILENSDRSMCYRILVQAMTRSSDGSEHDMPAKFNSIVTRCLAKMLKAAGDVHQLDVRSIFASIQHFFEVCPPGKATWEQQETDALKTIKSLMSHLTRSLGTEVMQYLPSANSDDIVHAFVVRVLQSLNLPVEPASATAGQAANQAASSAEAEVHDDTQEKATEQEQEEPSAVVHTETDETDVAQPANEDVDTQAELDSIFKDISNTEKTDEGLQALYEFRKQHPKVSIEGHMSKTTKPFQAYIERNLKKLAQKEERGAAGSSTSAKSITAGMAGASKSAEDFKRRLAELQARYQVGGATSSAVVVESKHTVVSASVSGKENVENHTSTSGLAQEKTASPKVKSLQQRMEAVTGTTGSEETGTTVKATSTSLADLRERLAAVGEDPM